jgi:FkbM family methyltransferase
MRATLGKRLRFWTRRIFRTTFVIGIYRKLREIAIVPYTHRLLRQASDRRGSAFTVVQVGAHDGNLLDPLSVLVRRHRWSGVLVEPNPENFKKLQETYRDHPQIRLEQAAISDQDSTVTLYRPKPLPGGEPNPFIGQDTLHPENHRKLAWIDGDWQNLIEPIDVPCLTLATLLAKHAVTEIDFFLTDTEGHDLIILDQLDFDSAPPQFLQFEFIHMAKDELKEFTDRLRGHGYKLLYLRWDIFAYRPPLSG